MISNIERARSVLDPNAWSACGVRGRELVSEDLEALVSLGEDDPLFVWEREPQPRRYFEGLLQFRLGHYWKYGFGVHGLWLDELLIGQCGLQVLNDEQDQVEFAVFLGRDHKHKGLGSCLARHLVAQCKVVGITELYGVVRPDNPEGTAMMRAIGAESIGEVQHFRQSANVFRLPLRNEV